MGTIASMRANAEARHGITWDSVDWLKAKAITEWAGIETPPIRGRGRTPLSCTKSGITSVAINTGAA